MLSKIITFSLSAIILVACAGGGSDSGEESDPVYTMELSFSRVDTTGLDPFDITVTLNEDGGPFPNATLELDIPKGVVSSVANNGDGTYVFRVTPSSTGVYPVTVSYENVSVTQSAVVIDDVGARVGQPLSIAGDVVNTEGYEDGITITPDGQYLFVQYGPIYFSGIFLVSTICSDSNYSLYNLNDCMGRNNSEWIFKSIGPRGGDIRPNFPDARISTTGDISHLSNIVVTGVANGVAVPPTVFYGFKRQNDGSFAEPFLVAFEDEGRAVQSPYGLSFQMTSSTTANVTFAWNNVLDQLGNDGVDVYTGSVQMEQTNTLGNVSYSGDFPSTIVPNVVPPSFTDHLGVQGNTHIDTNDDNEVIAIWVDDEVSTHDLTVYMLTAGTYPNGTWQKLNLPSKINTLEDESQPFFDGDYLYLRRDNRIVAHEYLGLNRLDYDLDSAWGDEEIIMESGFNALNGEIIAVGEPTLARVGGKIYLYFVYGITRAQGMDNYVDINMDAGFVEIHP